VSRLNGLNLAPRRLVPVLMALGLVTVLIVLAVHGDPADIMSKISSEGFGDQPGEDELKSGNNFFVMTERIADIVMPITILIGAPVCCCGGFAFMFTAANPRRCMPYVLGPIGAILIVALGKVMAD
jgi:hypothetical protein